MVVQERLKFSGVVKTATNKHPMNHLKSIGIQKRGDRVCLVIRENEGYCDLLVFAWMDRERKYFICFGSNLSEGLPNIRSRLPQEIEEPDAKPKSLTLVTDQPQACKLYYNWCVVVDRHNRCRQIDLKLETKLVTKNSSKRINMSLLSICIINTWFAYSDVLGSNYESRNNFLWVFS